MIKIADTSYEVVKPDPERFPKSGSFGMTVVGGLIFGIGFAVLGYYTFRVSGMGR